jgi:hypothetical protein
MEALYQEKVQNLNHLREWDEMGQWLYLILFIYFLYQNGLDEAAGFSSYQ